MPLPGFSAPFEKFKRVLIGNVVNWPLLPAGNPTNSRHPSPKSYVDAATVSAITSKNSNFSIGGADKGVFFDCTGTITPTIAAAGTLGSGWQGMIRNSGTGVLTFSGTIDGVVNPKMYPGEFWRLISNGSAIYALGRERGEILLNKQVVGSAVSVVDFTSFITTDFDEYILKGKGVVPSVDAANAYFRASTNNGSSYLATSEYGYQHVGTDGTSTPSSGNDHITLNRVTIGNADGEGIDFEIRLIKPAGTQAIKAVRWHSDERNTSAGPEGHYGTANIATASALNACRFLFHNGNTAAGSFTLSGVREA